MSARRSLAVALVCGALAIAATSALGVWQLRRAAGKEALLRQAEAAAQAPAAFPDAGSLGQPESLLHRHLRLRGRWVADHVVYLDNRPQGGRAGFYVLMAFQLEEPAPAEIVVNRGWLPRDPADRARIAPYSTPDGVVDVTGIVLADEPRLLELAGPGERPLRGIWQNFDFRAFGSASGRTPLPIVVREDAAAGGPDDGLSRDWPDRSGDLQSQIDRHHGYAFQWFALAATFFGIALYRIVRIRRHVRHVPH